MRSWVKRLGSLPIDRPVLVTLVIELGVTALQVWRKHHSPRSSPAWTPTRASTSRKERPSPSSRPTCPGPRRRRRPTH